MSDTRTLAEELDYMGRRTTDPEASDLLIQAAQEVFQREEVIQRLREWTEHDDHGDDTGDKELAANINGYLTAQSEVQAILAALTENPIPSETEDEK